MRNLKTFVTDITRKPLVIFPLIALFHIAMLVYTIWQDFREPVLWIQIGWALGYTIFWIFICDYRKWAAMGYLALTSIDLMLFFFLKSSADMYASNMFILAVLFGFFVLFFYKRFT